MKKLSLGILCILVLVSTASVGAYANIAYDTTNVEEFNEDQTLVIDETATPEKQEALIHEFLNNPDIEMLVVLDESLLGKEFNYVDENNSGERMMITNPLGPSSRVVNRRELSRTQGTNVVAVASGMPGMTLTIDYIKSITNTYTNQFTATVSQISRVVGFSVTDTEQIGISTQMFVPDQHDGKNVKELTLEAFPFLEQIEYTVQRKSNIFASWKDQGTGVASRAIGIAFTYSYTYQ